jgi:IS30 family transposase
MAFKAIAGRIGKDPTTVSKEVKKHFTVKELPYNRTDMSGRPIRTVCPSLMKVPFVCNPCERRHRNCSFQKRFYNAKEAQRAYETLLSEAREGVPLNKAEFYEIDRIVSNGIKRGQHLYHIMQSNQLGVSKSTLYRHLKRGYLSVKPLDFPCVVKFKARRAKREDYVPKAARIGRSHDCFLFFIGFLKKSLLRLKETPEPKYAASNE